MRNTNRSAKKWPESIKDEGRGPDLESTLRACALAQKDIEMLPDESGVSASDIVAATAMLMANDPFAAAAANGTVVTTDIVADLDNLEDGWGDCDF